MDGDETMRSRSPERAVDTVIAVALLLVLAMWMAGESHYRSCVQATEAKFPAVPVSAASGRQTGPLKLSFVKERTAAVEGCGRLP